jgi:WD40 repeat protein
MATISDDGQMIVWEPATGRDVYISGEHSGSIKAFDWENRPSALLATGGSDSRVIWYTLHINELQPLATFELHNAPIVALAFDPGPDGYLASAASNGTLFINTLATTRRNEPIAAIVALTSPILSMAWSPDGAYLAISKESGEIVLYENNFGDSQ